ncbi:MAG: glycine cleavage system aminomethyltransferase GcvT [Gammaproteobacteria bacterium]|nr:glycine cleavage system aminomethyltransferase GcvT [Gammaproteobacteria bacterium]
MTQRTPLYNAHVALGARMVDFAGWEMPLHYGSQIEEHHAVRGGAGVFDISHMGVIDLHGNRSRDLLRYLLANDVARLDTTPGRALYSCMLNERGGVVDDLIVSYMSPIWYRLVVNAATFDKDFNWISRHASSFAVDLESQEDLAMIAVQGPQARQQVHQLGNAYLTLGQSLGKFYAATKGDVFISRTGYTGEDGYEIILPADDLESIWQQLLDNGVKPCGLGARDTLRLEAGMSLYGQDIDDNHTPLESGLAWTVALQPASRQFIGRSALQQQLDAGLKWQLAGLRLEGRGVMRSGLQVTLPDQQQGVITSGGFSPTRQQSIAMARLPLGDYQTAMVTLRQQQLPATVMKLPFVRHGQPL